MDALTPEAQGKWICGSYIILVSRLKNLHRSLVQAAATQFGTAVELELKSTVFVKFRDCVSRSSDLRPSRKEEFGLPGQSKAMTLGQMHYVLGPAET